MSLYIVRTFGNKLISLQLDCLPQHNGIKRMHSESTAQTEAVIDSVLRLRTVHCKLGKSSGVRGTHNDLRRRLSFDIGSQMQFFHWSLLPGQTCRLKFAFCLGVSCLAQLSTVHPKPLAGALAHKQPSHASDFFKREQHQKRGRVREGQAGNEVATVVR